MQKEQQQKTNYPQNMTRRINKFMGQRKRQTNVPTFKSIRYIREEEINETNKNFSVSYELQKEVGPV